MAERLREWHAWQDDIDPLSVGENNLIDYCVSHTNALVLDATRNVVGADK